MLMLLAALPAPALAGVDVVFDPEADLSTIATYAWKTDSIVAPERYPLSPANRSKEHMGEPGVSKPGRRRPQGQRRPLSEPLGDEPEGHLCGRHHA